MSEFQTESDVLFDDILAQKQSLETLMDHKEFLNEVYMQNEDLFAFLAKDVNIEKLLQWMYFPDPKKVGFKKASQYSFLAYTALSDCEPTLTEKIILNKKYLNKVFCLIKDKKESNLTARGYFQGIMKNFISELNPFLPGFIKTLKLHAEDYIFPLVRNLNRANCEIIKDILASQNEKLKKLQLCIFEFLLFYFLNEQFDKKNQDLKIVFDNLNDIFQFLKTLETVYNYKLKYEYTLYSEEYVKNNSLKEPIYHFKLILLNYIAYTQQIKTCKSPHKFISTLSKYSKSKNSFFYKLEMMKFFKILSKNEEFHKNVNLQFIQKLLQLLEKEKGKDILHNQIFAILENLAPCINRDQQMIELVAKFIQKCHLELKMPQELKKSCNSISLNHIYNLAKNLDLSKLNKKAHEEVQNYRDLLSTIFTQLCAEEVNSTISDIQELSEVQYVIKNDFGNFDKRQLIPEDDARFHYEDDILQPEPLLNTSDNKLQQRKSFHKNHTFDSELSDLKEPENEEEHYEKLILSQNESNLDDNLSYRFENKSGIKSQVKSELLSPNTSGLQNEKKKFGKKEGVHTESILKNTQFNQMKLFNFLTFLFVIQNSLLNDSQLINNKIDYQ